tara:strand:- start:366 stop:1448 length:1083 start_codon:yes stop_codon:yes gene_type:complete
MNIKKVFDSKNLLVNSNLQIDKAIEKLNNSQANCLLVTKAGKLEGTLTDSDLRRKGFFKKRNDTIRSIFNPKPKYVFFDNYKNFNCQKIFNNFSYIDVIPIVNKKMEIKELAFRDPLESNIKKSKNNSKINVLILAGGLGTRLKEITSKIPKPLIPFKREPYLVKLINKIEKYNFNKIYISLFYMKDYFKNILKKNLSNKISKNKIIYILENKPLGTAGSIKKIKSNDQNMLILNSDVIFNLNLQLLIDDHIYNKSFITIAVKPYIVKIPFGVISIDKKGIKNFKEKPTKTYFISVGIYVVNGKIKKLIKTNESVDMPQLIIRAKKRGFKVNYFLMNEDALDFGTYENLNIAKEKFEDFF